MEEEVVQKDPARMFDGFYLEKGMHGEDVPMYWNAQCEELAIGAFLTGNWGALTSFEIALFKAAAAEGGVTYVHP